MDHSVEHMLGRILATLENIDDKLERLEDNHEKIEFRVGVLERGYYQAVGFISLVTFVIGMSGTYIWNRIIGS